MDVKTTAKRIAVSLVMQSPAGRKQLAGIFRYTASGLPWDVEIFRNVSIWDEKPLSRIVDERFDGIITSTFTRNERSWQTLARHKIPIVLIDGLRPDVSKSLRCGTVCSDDVRAGEDGARHLLSLGGMRSFGYIPASPAHARWSVARQNGLANALAAKGLHLDVYDSGSEPLESWLGALPKPTAVMAASDDIASAVLTLCHKLKIDVPDQLVLLGNDDDELICENLRPRLSSVRIGHEDEGFFAARMLDRMMRYPNRPVKDILIAPKGITVRESTRPVSPAAHLIDRALAYIHDHAAEGISVDDVVAHVNVSRRLVYLRFEEMLGKTVLDVLSERRLELLKSRLLSSTDSIAALSLACGFSSANHAKRVFKSATGMSMRDWRAAAGARPSQNPSAGDRQSGKQGSGPSPKQPRRRTTKAENRR